MFYNTPGVFHGKQPLVKSTKDLYDVEGFFDMASRKQKH